MADILQIGSATTLIDLMDNIFAVRMKIRLCHMDYLRPAESRKLASRWSIFAPAGSSLM